MKLLFFVFIVFSEFSCNFLTSPKSDNVDTSQQFMYATINGTEWRADSKFVGGNYPASGYTNRIFIYGATMPAPGTGPMQSIAISLNNFTGVNTYILNNLNRGSYTYSENAQSTNFSTTSRDTGTVNITRMDPTTQIVSGTFLFRVRAELTDSVVIIFNGAFEAIYHPDG